MMEEMEENTEKTEMTEQTEKSLENSVCSVFSVFSPPRPFGLIAVEQVVGEIEIAFAGEAPVHG